MTRGSGNGDPYVPLAFVDLLRIGLAKMIGAGWLHPNLGGLEFWNKFPTKYQTVRSYEKSMVIIFVAVFLFIERFFRAAAAARTSKYLSIFNFACFLPQFVLFFFHITAERYTAEHYSNKVKEEAERISC